VGHKRGIGSYHHQFSRTQGRYGPLQHAWVQPVELTPQTPGRWRSRIQRHSGQPAS